MANNRLDYSPEIITRNRIKSPNQWSMFIPKDSSRFFIQLSPIIESRRERLKNNIDWKVSDGTFDSKIKSVPSQLSTEILQIDYSKDASLYFEPSKKKKSKKNGLTSYLNRTITLSKCNLRIWNYDKTFYKSDRGVIDILVQNVRKEYGNRFLECSVLNHFFNKIIVHLGFSCVLNPENMSGKLYRIYSPYKVNRIKCDQDLKCYYNVLRITEINKN